jgi:hypothetical protein
MIASISSMYGPPAPLPRPSASRPACDTLDEPAVVGQWRSGGTVVVLRHSPSSGTFSLSATSAALDQQARRAQAAAVTMDAREAPARDGARQEADAARTDAELKRAANKAAFRP